MKESTTKDTIWFYLYEVLEQGKLIYVNGSCIVITSGYGLLTRKMQTGHHWYIGNFYSLTCLQLHESVYIQKKFIKINTSDLYTYCK